MSKNSSDDVKVHKSKEELLLYLSREMGMDYSKMEDYYEREATAVR